MNSETFKGLPRILLLTTVLDKSDFEKLLSIAQSENYRQHDLKSGCIRV